VWCDPLRCRVLTDQPTRLTCRQNVEARRQGRSGRLLRCNDRYGTVSGGGNDRHDNVSDCGTPLIPTYICSRHKLIQSRSLPFRHRAVPNLPTSAEVCSRYELQGINCAPNNPVYPRCSQQPPQRDQHPCYYSHQWAGHPNHHSCG